MPKNIQDTLYLEDRVIIACFQQRRQEVNNNMYFFLSEERNKCHDKSRLSSIHYFFVAISILN